MTITTKAALAAELGVSKAAVSKYVRNGLPVRPDGRLDREECLHWIKRKVAYQLGHNGYSRARDLIRDGYADGLGHVSREYGKVSYRYTEDGSLESYYFTTSGERVVIDRKPRWQQLSFQSAEHYESWLEASSRAR